jgi:hypothetical protein
MAPKADFGGACSDQRVLQSCESVDNFLSLLCIISSKLLPISINTNERYQKEILAKTNLKDDRKASFYNRKSISIWYQGHPWAKNLFRVPHLVPNLVPESISAIDIPFLCLLDSLAYDVPFLTLVLDVQCCRQV